jgi:hypothetical protein
MNDMKGPTEIFDEMTADAADRPAENSLPFAEGRPSRPPPPSPSAGDRSGKTAVFQAVPASTEAPAFMQPNPLAQTMASGTSSHPLAQTMASGTAMSRARHPRSPWAPIQTDRGSVPPSLSEPTSGMPPVRREPSGHYPSTPSSRSGHSGLGSHVPSSSSVPAPSVPPAGSPSGYPLPSRMPLPKLPSFAPPPPPNRPDPPPSKGARAPLARPPVVELMWFADDEVDEIEQRWHEAVAPRSVEPLGFDDELPPEEPTAARRRRIVLAALTRVRAIQPSELRTTMLESIDDAGGFVAPLVIVHGRLELPFDELQVLEATLAAVAPLAADDKELQATVATVRQAMQTAWIEGSEDIVNRLTERVRAAYRKADRLLNEKQLREHTERILLKRRSFQGRTVFGSERIRGVVVEDDRRALPAYLPEELRKELPMLPAFDARLIARVHPQQDPYDPHDFALDVVALGRIVRLS